MGWKRRFGELESATKVVSPATGTTGLQTSYFKNAQMTRIHFTGSSVPFVLNHDSSEKTEFVKVYYGCSSACSATFQIVNASNGRTILGASAPLSESNGSMITTQLYTATLSNDKGLLTGSGATIWMLSGTVSGASPTVNPLFVHVFWRNSTT